MRSTPFFADPKADFVFQRIFGSEGHKPALIGFLNDILQPDGAHRITSVALLPPEQRPKVSELEHSIVDVLTVLRIRGIPVPDAARERILAAKDPSLRERWLEKAVVAASIADVLGDTG
jgi:hypothetical protein